MKQFVIEDMKSCTGCGACINICPSGAVDMKVGEGGFFYPHIDTSKCTECNLCTETCPAANLDYPNNINPEVYAVISKTELRKKSSSAGVFSMLASWTLEQGGLVCGAVFSPDYRSVSHLLSDNPQDIQAMRKSKYIQSNIGTVYQEIKTALSTGRAVLFTGCPCQVAGLRRYLGRSYDSLVLVDVLCHSVPSPKAWQSYLDTISKGKEIVSIDFRDKSDGWKVGVTVKFSDGSQFIEKDGCIPWIEPFLHGLTCRESCKLCQFARVSRQGDLTLGDFWGIELYDETLNDNMGTSMVLVNNEKGCRVWNEIQHDSMIERIEHLSLDIAVKHSSYMIHRGDVQFPGRKVMLDALNEGKDYGAALREAVMKKYDFGIIGWWYSTNYGAALTSYALYSAIETLGYRPILLDISKPLARWNSAIENKLNVDRQFIYHHCEVSPAYSSSVELRDANDLCEGFVIGSDQLWNLWPGQQAAEGSIYFLDFATEEKQKVAYATSFGADEVSCTSDEKTVISCLMQRFDGISVREKSGVQLCRDIFHTDAELVLDPVFLCDAEKYRILSNKGEHAVISPGERFITAYILQYTKEKEEYIQQLAQKLECKIVLILDLNPNNRSNQWTLPISMDISVEDWLYYIANAEMVLTDSYHGMCFSIIFQQNFVVLPPRDGFERFHTLASLLDIEDRIIFDMKEILTNEYLLDTIDYSGDVLRSKIENGFAWLKEALQAKRKAVSSVYDALSCQFDWKIQKMREEYETRLSSLYQEMSCQEKQIVDCNEQLARLYQEMVRQDKQIIEYNTQLERLHQEMVCEEQKPTKRFSKRVRKNV